MADRLDVAGRLAEGRPALERTDVYVRACADPIALGELYDSEEGLDLHALDADCATLRSVGAELTEALRLQQAQTGVLAAAWTGPAADAAVAFLQRHCDAAAGLVAEVRAAAQRCESLRDNLWQLVDSKVATAIAIDDRTLAQRSAWLAAAAAVAGGAADESARELVDRQVKPYVHNDIEHDWVTAMRSARAGTAASFDMVTDRLAAVPPTQFEIPGDLGPMSPPPSVGVPAATVATTSAPDPVPARARPAALTAPTAPVPAASAPAMPNTAVKQPDWGSALGSAGGLSGGGTGLGGGAGLGTLGGLASRIIQEMGGLLSSASRFPDGTDPGEDPFDDYDDDDDDPGHAKRRKDSDTTQTGEKPTAVEPPSDVPVPTAQPPAAAPMTAPPELTPPQTPAPQPPSPPAASPGSTPCEIAANALPQAGQ